MIDWKHRNDYINDYKKKHYKRIIVEIPKKYYEKHLAPSAQALGESMSAFIRKAIEMRLATIDSESSKECDS